MPSVVLSKTQKWISILRYNFTNSSLNLLASRGVSLIHMNSEENSSAVIRITEKRVKGNESGRDNLMRVMLQTRSSVLLIVSRHKPSYKYLIDFEMHSHVV